MYIIMVELMDYGLWIMVELMALASSLELLFLREVCSLCFCMGQGCNMCCRFVSHIEALLKNTFA